MLPRAARLKRNRDFRAVYSRRRSYSTEHIVMYIRQRPQGADGIRFGFVISKKIAKKAHDRNKLKRRLREICRVGIARNDFQVARYDVLIVARIGAPSQDFARLVADVETLSRQAGLVTCS